MRETNKLEKRQGHGRRVVAGAAVLLGVAIAILWSWNTLAVEFFGAPAFAFRHAAAATVALVLLVAAAGRHGRRRSLG